ncbi:hypothetical protein [Marinobacterium sedimentorum]|jgi:hypothetical protein|uniref:hypothetical protein n=1 Tax=Marinobacterium sedimentorum TaxID=2927804 RepID=UPI0020C66878|nr:hypothetical protein [Marinobacterium sedimentorum]MCP8687819.1 hypothetical protein [Marinobacterium sedimentorum]
MKSYLFSTENGRGGVILCDIDAFDDAVVYLRQRFDGVVRVEQGLTLWTLEEGFGQFEPAIAPNLPVAASREPPPG